MGRPVIQAENISKLYRLGEVGTGTFAHDLNRWWASVRGKEDPYMKIGAVNDRTSKSDADYVWALKDINFSIQQGEVLGIIGKNGAGKSTLLKILSRTTAPTTGSLKVKGRIASLLEVGTGFHPDLSGRDNIYLNGAILGMTKNEITKKFDEIVAFAGVERYIDTPVKRYSSGMYVRLAFAVAAHLESEILIIDEVLAVGDQEFQDKCLGKMDDVAKKEGRTVLFVSHNMGSIIQLCSASMLMKQGQVIDYGATASIVEKYIATSSTESYLLNGEPKSEIFFNEVYTSANGDNRANEFLHDELITVNFKIGNRSSISSCQAGIALLDKYKRKIFTSHFTLNGLDNKKELSVSCKFPVGLITPGNYTVDVALFIENLTTYEYLSDICKFRVVDNGSEMSNNHNDYGCVFANCSWNIL